MRNTNKQHLINAAKAAGVALVDKGYKLEIFAPVGKVVKHTGNHFLSYYTKGWLRHQLYDEIVSDLKGGTEDCPDCSSPDGCEVCEEGIFIPEDVREDVIYSPELVQG